MFSYSECVSVNSVFCKLCEEYVLVDTVKNSFLNLDVVQKRLNVYVQDVSDEDIENSAFLFSNASRNVPDFDRSCNWARGRTSGG